MPATRVLQGSVAQSLLETRSLTEAERIMSDRLGWTELAHERSKAAGLGPRTDRSDQPIAGADLDAVRAFEQSAVRRGSRYTTFRRLAEQTCRSGRWAELRTALVEAEPERLAGPLWRLQ